MRLAALVGLASLAPSLGLSSRRSTNLDAEPGLTQAPLTSFPTLDEFHCGRVPATPTPGMPTVLFVGDSVSCVVDQYMARRQVFESVGIEQQHVGGCRWEDRSVDWSHVDWTQGSTEFGLNCTDPSTANNWLSFAGKFDVIHFNFGLHDLEPPHEYISTIGPSQHVSATTYAKNIRTLYDRLAARARVVVWATTTPAPVVSSDSCPLCRQNSEVKYYNDVALKALPPNTTVNDLNWVVNEHCGLNFEECDDWFEHGDVHPTEAGANNLIDATFGAVSSQLRPLYPALDSAMGADEDAAAQATEAAKQAGLREAAAAAAINSAADGAARRRAK
jgi:hypothetical protein